MKRNNHQISDLELTISINRNVCIYVRMHISIYTNTYILN